MAWFAANCEPLVVTDWIIGETLTLLRSRGHSDKTYLWGEAAFSGELCIVHDLTPHDIRDSWDTFRTFADKDWSFTDCTSRAVMLRPGLTRAVSFDRHFRQFGTVAVLP